MENIYTMKCHVTPIGGCEIELSYRVKCVAVESERVFGNITVTHHRNTAELLSIPWSKRQNLIRQYLEGPNLLELNRQVDVRIKHQNNATLHRSKHFPPEKDHKNDFFQKSLQDKKEDTKYEVQEFIN
jgi:hypothetical protein